MDQPPTQTHIPGRGEGSGDQWLTSFPTLNRLTFVKTLPSLVLRTWMVIIPVQGRNIHFFLWTVYSSAAFLALVFPCLCSCVFVSI